MNKPGFLLAAQDEAMLALVEKADQRTLAIWALACAANYALQANHRAADPAVAAVDVAAERVWQRARLRDLIAPAASQ
jgi:hypothetical protein